MKTRCEPHLFSLSSFTMFITLRYFEIEYSIAATDSQTYSVENFNFLKILCNNHCLIEIHFVSFSR